MQRVTGPSVAPPPVHFAHDRLDDFIAVVNAQLQPLFMEIRKGLAEADGRTCYALVTQLCLPAGFPWHQKRAGWVGGVPCSGAAAAREPPLPGLACDSAERPVRGTQLS